MPELFNSPKHAIAFLKQRKRYAGIFTVVKTDYMIITEKLTDDNEKEAIRYLSKHKQYCTIDKFAVYYPD
jgi:hypothetical protein